MANELVVNAFKSLLGNLGRAVLHSQFPNDFEYHMVALELTTYEGSTIDFLSFPVLPKQIKRSEKSLANIKKTMGGISSVKYPGFIPIDFMLSGNFGKTFRVLINTQSTVDFKAIAYSLSLGKFERAYDELFEKKNPEILTPSFNVAVKTGYGVTKVLQSILNKSRGSIDGQPNLLFFYNMTFGESYLVEFINLEISQSMDQNLLYPYSLELRAVAPLSSVNLSKKKSLQSILAAGALQKGINTLASSVQALV